MSEYPKTQCERCSKISYAQLEAQLTAETARADAEMESNHLLISRNLELEAQLAAANAKNMIDNIENYEVLLKEKDRRSEELEEQLTSQTERADKIAWEAERAEWWLARACQKRQKP